MKNRATSSGYSKKNKLTDTKRERESTDLLGERVWVWGGPGGEVLILHSRVMVAD